MEDFILTDDCICLIDNHYGIYIPQMFAGQILSGNYIVSGIETKDLTDLATGPDHPEYWEIWEDVLGSVKIRVGRQNYFLHQDGDLWAIPETEETEE